jgi:hypothetical protein
VLTEKRGVKQWARTAASVAARRASECAVSRHQRRQHRQPLRERAAMRVHGTSNEENSKEAHASLPLDLLHLLQHRVTRSLHTACVQTVVAVAGFLPPPQCSGCAPVSHAARRIGRLQPSAIILWHDVGWEIPPTLAQRRSKQFGSTRAIAAIVDEACNAYECTRRLVAYRFVAIATLLHLCRSNGG